MEPKQPEPGFEAEVKAAKEAGFEVGYVGLEAYFGDEVRLHAVPEDCGPTLYRGWIVKPEDYQRMGEALAARGGSLLTSLEAYLHCYHLPNWYEAIGGKEVTPRSLCIRGTTFSNLDDIAFRVSMTFGHHGVIIKDFIKSRKHDWYDACYIGSALDQNEVKRVTRNFVDGQGDTLVGGLVFREFLKLKRIGVHSRSRLPLVNEHRIFVFDGVPFYQAPYWFEGDYSGNVPSLQFIRPILSKVKSPFYAVDVAEREEGGWVIIELNDGGSAGIPEGGDPQDFYKALREVIVRKEALTALVSGAPLTEKLQKDLLGSQTCPHGRDITWRCNACDEEEGAYPDPDEDPSV